MLKPEDVDIILSVIQKLEKWSGKLKNDEASEDWKGFKDIKRAERD